MRLEPATLLIDDDGPSSVLVFLAHPDVDFDLQRAAGVAAAELESNDCGEGEPDGARILKTWRQREPRHYRFVPGRDDCWDVVSILRPAEAGSRGAFWGVMWERDGGGQ